MTLAGLIVTVVLAVPPGEWVVDHSQPGHFTQPTIRHFQRREVDDSRRHAWNHHVDVLDLLWAEYRSAGSTREAWERYKHEAAAAKRCYIYQDPYYIGQIYRYVPPAEIRCPHAQHGKPCCDQCAASHHHHSGKGHSHGDNQEHH